jgi:predicted transcriptional regulator
MEPLQHNEAVSFTMEIVIGYVGNNSVPADALPGLIRSVYRTIADIGCPEPAKAPAEPLKPAVSIKASVTPDYLICLDDGLRFKSLKRHLAVIGMTPADYRAKWGLPETYPMVAANYSAKRTELAKSIGLGRKAAPSLSVVETEAA